MIRPKTGVQMHAAQCENGRKRTVSFFISMWLMGTCTISIPRATRASRVWSQRPLGGIRDTAQSAVTRTGTKPSRRFRHVCVAAQGFRIAHACESRDVQTAHELADYVQCLCFPPLTSLDPSRHSITRAPQLQQQDGRYLCTPTKSGHDVNTGTSKSAL